MGVFSSRVLGEIKADIVNISQFFGVGSFSPLLFNHCLNILHSIILTLRYTLPRVSANRIGSLSGLYRGRYTV